MPIRYPKRFEIIGEKPRERNIKIVQYPIIVFINPADSNLTIILNFTYWRILNTAHQ